MAQLSFDSLSGVLAFTTTANISAEIVPQVVPPGQQPAVYGYLQDGAKLFQFASPNVIKVVTFTASGTIPAGTKWIFKNMTAVPSNVMIGDSDAYLFCGHAKSTITVGTGTNQVYCVAGSTVNGQVITSSTKIGNTTVTVIV